MGVVLKSIGRNAKRNRACYVWGCAKIMAVALLALRSVLLAAPQLTQPLKTWMVEGVQPNSGFGTLGVSGGDVNGDGYADLLVTAPQFRRAGDQAVGCVFVYHGSKGGLSNAPVWQAFGEQTGDEFGFSAAPAGDVNRDGLSDLVVGARLHSNGVGKVYLFLGSSNGLSRDPSWTFSGNEPSGRLGCRVASGGDVNGDGFDDILVVAYRWRAPERDVAQLLVFHGSATGPGAQPDGRCQVPHVSTNFSGWIASAGDVNGDKFGDVIVGVSEFDYRNVDDGRALLFYGSATGLSRTPGWSTTWEPQGPNPREQMWKQFFGNYVGCAGDVNKDGFSDIFITAYFADQGEPDEGLAFIYYGSKSGPSAKPDWTAESNEPHSLFGTSAGTAGDVNGDGYVDFVVGAMQAAHGQYAEGVCALFLGSAKGLDTVPVWTAESEGANARLGVSVGSAGDVNGDGFADIFATTANYARDFEPVGRVYVYYGSPSGPPGSSGWSMAGSPQTRAGTNAVKVVVEPARLVLQSHFAVAGTNAQPRTARIHASRSQWTAEFWRSNAQFGSAVAGAGDVNGDGYADVLIGAKNYSGEISQRGQVLIFYGSATGLVIEASWSFAGRQASALLGNAVALVDVNGDRLSDVLVGAFREDLNRAVRNVGRAFLFHSSPNGPGEDPVWSASGERQTDVFGWSVNDAGDVNGDGYRDVIVGAPRYGRTLRQQGAAFVYHGSANGLSRTSNWAVTGGQVDLLLGTAVASAGDVNGDGFSDVVVGAPGDNTPSGTSAGRAFVYYGSTNGLSGEENSAVDGGEPLARFGTAVAGVGDLNKDGFADILVGAPGSEKGRERQGQARLYFGSTNGLGSEPAWTVRGEQALERFGESLSRAGDVNGDGFTDILIGAPYHDSAEQNAGRVYLYLGSANGLEQTPAWLADGGQTDAMFGSALAPAGDVNRDGYDDFVIGASFYDSPARNSGRVELFYGSPTNFQRVTNFVELPPPLLASSPAGSLAAAPLSSRTLWFATSSFAVLSLGLLVWLRRRQAHVAAAAIEEERSRLARDLHDGLGSKLARLSHLGSDDAAAGVPSDAPLSETAREAMQAMHEAVWSVNPEHDTLESLVSFLGEQADRDFAGTRIRCYTDLPTLVPEIKLAPDVRKHIFLATKEALANTLKHSGATEVWLRASYASPTLTVSVEDNGRGFVAESGRRFGNGLANMRRRMEAVGGSCDIESQPGNGATITLRVRLKEER